MGPTPWRRTWPRECSADGSQSDLPCARAGPTDSVPTLAGSMPLLPETSPPRCGRLPWTVREPVPCSTSRAGFSVSLSARLLGSAPNHVRLFATGTLFLPVFASLPSLSSRRFHTLLSTFPNPSSTTQRPPTSRTPSLPTQHNVTGSEWHLCVT